MLFTSPRGLVAMVDRYFLNGFSLPATPSFG